MAAPSSQPLHVDAVLGLDPVLVHVCGDLDVASAPSLTRVLIPLQPRMVDLDLSDVTFIDSCGVNVLLSHYRHCRAAGGFLTVIQPSRPVRQVLQILGLEELLTKTRGIDGSDDRWDGLTDGS
ncbi:STAS domain-containing protein [Streptomyces sp. NPDC041068]|uniref:STAS domain-containing protein n=1 Tax=Streptomyces sp. NPDC041068 TaxID=3155130 RepID=UPI0033E58F44